MISLRDHMISLRDHMTNLRDHMINLRDHQTNHNLIKIMVMKNHTAVPVKEGGVVWQRDCYRR